MTGRVTHRRLRRRRLVVACDGDRAQARTVETIIDGKAAARRDREQQRQLQRA